MRHLDFPICLSVNGDYVCGDPFKAQRSYFRSMQLNAWSQSKSNGRLAKIDSQRLNFLLRSASTRSCIYESYFFDSVTLTLPHDQCLDVACDFKDECALCGSNRTPDNNYHYLTCAFVTNQIGFQGMCNNITRIPTINKTFHNLGAFLRFQLRQLIAEASHSFQQRFPSWHRQTREVLLHTYLSDLADRRECFRPQAFESRLEALNRDNYAIPPQTRCLLDRELCVLQRDSKIPMDLILITSLDSIPQIFCRWHCLSRSGKCARDFGEVLDIIQSHHDLTVLLFFQDICFLFEHISKIAYQRLQFGGKTWIIHSLRFEPKRWLKSPPHNLSLSSERRGNFKITIFERKTKDFFNFTNFPCKISHNLSTIIDISPTLMCLPFLGLGKFNHLLDSQKIPQNHHNLFSCLRDMIGVDFLLGFFPPTLLNLFPPHSRKNLRATLLTRGKPLLKITHDKRLLWYIYLKTYFNFFPKRKKKKMDDFRPNRLKRRAIDPTDPRPKGHKSKRRRFANN